MNAQLKDLLEYVHQKIVAFVISVIFFLQCAQMIAPTWLDWLFNILILVFAWIMARVIRLGRS